MFSFKLRGAYNKMAHLNEKQSWKGVVACSAGMLHPVTLTTNAHETREPCSRCRILSTKAQDSCNNCHARRHTRYQAPQRLTIRRLRGSSRC